METNTDKRFRANDATPAYPVHPGGILGEELKARAKIESGLEGIPAALWMKLQESYNLDVQRKRINPSRLVTGYNPAQFNSQPAHLSEPQSPYGKKRQVTLTIPESDMDLLVSLATRLGWQCQI